MSSSVSGVLRPRRLQGRDLALLTVVVATWMAAPAAEARREAGPAGSVALCGFGDTCRTVGCHFTFPFGSPALAWELRLATPEPLPSWYVPGQPMELELVADDLNAFYMGFQLSAVLDCPFAVNAGSLELLEPMRTTIVQDDFELDYLTHSCTCADLYECCGFVPEALGSGLYRWTFRWTPPPRGSGPVVMNIAFNSANGDGSPENDRISIGEVWIEEEPCPPRIDDLRVRKAACDAGSPTETRVELYREDGGPMAFIREQADPAQLSTLPGQWPAADDCSPLVDGRRLVAWSVAPPCSAGGEGHH